MHVVGGAVRDALLGRAPHELDVVVEGDAAPVARRAAERLGGDVVVHDRFGTATVRPAGGVRRRVGADRDLPAAGRAPRGAPGREHRGGPRPPRLHRQRDRAARSRTARSTEFPAPGRTCAPAAARTTTTRSFARRPDPAAAAGPLRRAARVRARPHTERWPRRRPSETVSAAAGFRAAAAAGRAAARGAASPSTARPRARGSFRASRADPELIEAASSCPRPDARAALAELAPTGRPRPAPRALDRLEFEAHDRETVGGGRGAPATAGGPAPATRGLWRPSAARRPRRSRSPARSARRRRRGCGWRTCATRAGDRRARPAGRGPQRPGGRRRARRRPARRCSRAGAGPRRAAGRRARP